MSSLQNRGFKTANDADRHPDLIYKFLMMVVVGGAQEGSVGIGTVIGEQVVLEIMIYYGSTRKNILFNRKKDWFYCFSQTGCPDKHLKVF